MAVSLELGVSRSQQIEQRVLLTVPIANVGLDGAASVAIDSVKLLLADGFLIDNQARLAFPRVFTPFGPGKVAGLAVRFASAGPSFRPLSDYGPHELLVTGRIDGSLPFTLTQPVGIAASRPAAGVPFFGQLLCGANEGVFQYVIANVATPATSPQKIMAVAIDFVRPFTVLGTPPGWTLDTDGSTYVLWSAPPEISSAQIAGGDLLGGFDIASDTNAFEGGAYLLSTWDYSTNAPGPMASDMTIVSAR
jgi:hypothetical protein